MHTLYYSPATASMAPHILLRELGIPHELVLTDTEVGAQRAADYLELNPNARVPTLVTGETVLYEAAAICLYLCETHPEPCLAPAEGAPGRADYLKWMVYLTNTVQADLMLYFYPDRYVPPDQVDALKARIVERAREMFTRIDSVLEGRAYLLGDSFTVADIYLFMVCRWTRNMTWKARTLPRLGPFLAKLMARPAFRDAYAIEGIVEPYY